MALTALNAKQAKPRDKDYKLADGKGLYLLVKTSGAKYWRLKYRFAGKEKTYALGVFPEVTLAEAREETERARYLLRRGIDPSAERKARRTALDGEIVDPFRVVATEWFHTRMATRSKSHRDRTWRALERDLFPVIGDRATAQIKPPDVLQALRAIESRGAIETARRANQTASQVFRFAMSTGRAQHDPTVGLRDALQLPVKRHLPAITDPAEVGRLMVAIDGFQGTPVVQAALKISPLFFCRPGELRHMEWAEVNWREHRWELPAEKMKIRTPHIVPLARQAEDILLKLHARTGHGRYVFPSPRGGSRPLSENGVRTALRTMGYDNETMTPHGFRAMARTLLDEVLKCRVDYIEQQLAHRVKDPNGRAYNRTAHLQERHNMMQAWADYLDTLRANATRP